MSKNSSKQMYTQLVEWLAVRGKTKTNQDRGTVVGTVSRMDYAKQKGRI